MAKSNIVSPPAKFYGLQSPVSQSAVRQPTSQANIYHPVSPKTTSQSTIPIEPVSSRTIPQKPTSPQQNTQITPSKQPITSPKSSNNTFVDLEIKHTSQVFDIVSRKNVTSPNQQASFSTEGHQHQPIKSMPVNSPKTGSIVQTPKNAQIVSTLKAEEKKEKSLENSVARSASKV